MNLICNMLSGFTLLKFLPHPSGTNELTKPTELHALMKLNIQSFFILCGIRKQQWDKV